MKAHGVLAIAVLTAAGLGAGTPLAAREKSWVGELVMPTKPPKDVKFGDMIDGQQVYFTYSGVIPIKVRDERAGRLRIHDGRREGWADKADFVLVRDAPAYFDRRVQANPNDRWALYGRASAWLYRGELDRAIKDFDECIRSDPTNSAAYQSRGVAWRAKKELDKAIKDLDEAIRLDRESVLAFTSRGAVWSDKKQYDKAIEDLDEAIRLDPKYPLPVYDKACVRALQGRTDDAIENLTKALELGYRDFEHMARDRDLDSIRGHPRYKQLLAKYGK
jgi:tetratricopeptide (TPR) repeat protein